MAIILDGKKIAKQIEDEVMFEIIKKDINPNLHVLLVGNDPASEIYVKRKIEACFRVGINSYLHKFNEEKDLLDKLVSLSEDIYCHGILVQLPLPDGYNKDSVFSSINPEKDVDVFNPINVGLLIQNRPKFLPPTPHAIQQILYRSNLIWRGQHVVVINRSNIVGKPLSSMLIQDNEDFANATVTVCHDNTPPEKLKQLCLIADVIVVAVGIPNFLTPDMVTCDQIIIDVGINRVDGKIVGDTHPDVKDKVAYITPVPGGVGPCTIAMLLHNVTKATI